MNMMSTWWPVIRLSWKNVWRNPLRSAVVILAVAIGTWAGISSSALMNGMTTQYTVNQLNTSTAHIKLSNPAYSEEYLPEYHIADADSIAEEVRAMDFVKAVSARSVVQGLAQSPANSYGVTVKGVDPAIDSLVSDVHSYINEGSYFPEVRNAVLVGEKLADRLDLRLRSRLVITFQDTARNITGGAFRVVGIFNTPIASFDEQTVIARKPDLNRMLGAEGISHEISLKLNHYKEADARVDTLKKLYPQLKTESWGDLSPALRYTDSSVGLMLYTFMTIIAIALIFGIVNTMLMAVLERTQELGMLMAIGVNKTRTFVMVMLETLFLSLTGVPVGMIFSWISISWLQSTGLDLSAFSEGLQEYGLSTVIYPQLPEGYYLNIGLLMFTATLLASIYPTLKVLKLRPVQAIRKL
jgi:ABC-type lipoprotein release transport system permease subunit